MGVIKAAEQSGGDVTAGFKGGMDVGDRKPITTSYLKAGLCPVNVHWHLGTEHYSAGEYDEKGTGPEHAGIKSRRRSRRAGAAVRLGFRCRKYDGNDQKFTKKYEWKHCDKSMVVGETY